MAKKLVKKDGSGNTTRWGVEIPTTGYAYWMLQALAIENGQKLMNEAGNEVYLTAPKTVAALDYWVDLSRKHNVMPTGSIDWATLRTDFLEGKTAMMWHTTGNLTAVKDGAKFNFGVAMLPAKERRGSPTGGGSFYIFKSASPEQQKAAVKFIQWMTAPERAAEWSMKTGYVAVSPAAYKTPAMEAYAKGFPPATVARDQLDMRCRNSRCMRTAASTNSSTMPCRPRSPARRSRRRRWPPRNSSPTACLRAYK